MHASIDCKITAPLNILSQEASALRTMNAESLVDVGNNDTHFR